MKAFVARQPILDRRQEVFGYELLFRSGLENNCQFRDPTSASSKIIADSAFLSEIGLLTEGKKAFINVTREILLGAYATFLPRESTVLEILETVTPDQETIDACAEIKRSGFSLALDDFVWSEAWEPLILLADYVKLDVLTTTSAERTSLVQRLAPKGIQFVAEKVETQKAFRQAQDEGFSLFQGYFFRKPEIMVQRDIPSSKIHYIQLLAEINRPELDITRLEGLIKRDVAFSYKLLRCVNSVSFGLRQTVRSVRQALVFLGESEFRKWASIIAMAGLASDGPRVLLTDAVTLARFCELLSHGTKMAKRDQELFLLGLLSTVDGILARPLPEIVASLPIAEDVRAALLGQRNALREVFEVGLAYEKGQWDALSLQADRLGLNEEKTPELYRQAIEWTGERLRATGHGVVHTVAS